MKEKAVVPCFANPLLDCPPECPSHNKNLKRFIKSVNQANRKTGESASPGEALTRMRAYAEKNEIRSVLNLAVALANQEAIQTDCLNAKKISDNSGVTVVRLD